MGVGRQRAALAGLEVHHVFSERAAPKRQRHLAGLAEHREIDAEAAVGGLGAGDGLEHQSRPARRAGSTAIVVVTCASTQDWVGIS